MFALFTFSILFYVPLFLISPEDYLGSIMNNSSYIIMTLSLMSDSL